MKMMRWLSFWVLGIGFVYALGAQEPDKETSSPDNETQQTQDVKNISSAEQEKEGSSLKESDESVQSGADEEPKKEPVSSQETDALKVVNDDESQESASFASSLKSDDSKEDQEDEPVEEKAADNDATSKPSESNESQEDSPSEASTSQEADQDNQSVKEDSREEGSVKWSDSKGVVSEADAAAKNPDEIYGIDTIDIADPQGNWLYKRVWWERAEAKYEKIRAVVNQVLESRTHFFAKRADLDKKVLDPFYLKVGMSQGELQEILSELIARAKKISEESKVAEIQNKIEIDKKMLIDVEQAVQQVMTKDEEIEKAILMLIDQIGKIRALEQQAWNDFKSIARVLDDKKARELFYKVNGAWMNIKELQQYIAKSFGSKFDGLISKTKELISKIDVEMLELQNSGIDLKKRLLSIQNQPNKIVEEVGEDEADVEKGFLSRYIIDPVKSGLNAIWNVVSWPYYKLFGSKDPDVDEDEEDADQPRAVASKTITPKDVSPKKDIPLKALDNPKKDRSEDSQPETDTVENQADSDTDSDSDIDESDNEENDPIDHTEAQ